MKCILRIGYTSILLPDHKGVEKLMDMLSKGMVCDSYYCSHDTVQIREEIEIGFTILPPSVKIVASPEMEEKMEEILALKPKKKALSAGKAHLIELKR